MPGLGARFRVWAKLLAQRVNVVTQYKYLGSIIDRNLNLNENFDKTYKKASNRLRLLQRMRIYLTTDAALKVFVMMIIPLFTYSSTLRVGYSETQLNKLKSLDNRAKNIINSNRTIPRIINNVNRDRCALVKKCLLNDFTTETFNNYFTTQQHSKQTRNNLCSIKLPRVKLEIARQGFYFAGGSLYNSLPTEIRKIDNFSDYKKALAEYFA